MCDIPRKSKDLPKTRKIIEEIIANKRPSFCNCCRKLIKIKETKMGKYCAYQYYDSGRVVHDDCMLTIEQAKAMFNNDYPDMVQKVESGAKIEVAIWIGMESDHDYKDTLIHLSSPVFENGRLYEKVEVVPFR